MNGMPPNSGDTAWLETVKNYVLLRQNEDGGYTFCQGAESNAQDTYYGLAILHLLGAQMPNIQRTIKWLRAFPANDLYSYYYVSKALDLCGERVGEELATQVLSLRRTDGSFGTVDVYVEVASEFESVFMATELLGMIAFTTDMRTTIDFLLRYQNDDGGFGAHGRSNLRSTFHAIASLRNLGYPTRSLRESLSYVRSCEKPSGGFTVVPQSSTPYMEDIYCGVQSLDLMGERCAYPEQTKNLVLRCFNSNGGFRRSIELGISTFEDTYFALAVLQRLGLFSW